MSNLIEIKKRISSITSTIKVTKVMQMIAAAKVAKIKQMIVSADKYSTMADTVLKRYISNTDDKHAIDVFFENKDKNKKNVLLILMSSDKGTCGNININIFKELTLLVEKCRNNGSTVKVCPIGKKAKKYLELHANNLNVSVLEEEIDAENYDTNKFNEFIAKIVNLYANNTFDSIYFIHHSFKNIITCRPVCEQILPLKREDIDCKDCQFINIEECENTPKAIVELFVRTKFYNAYISNLASIVSSRMNAMDNATKNGQEIIDDLQIKYNKSRQAGITSELSDIVSGFEAIS